MQDRPVALVTGANKGIGLETVRRLVGAGHRVYLASRDIERGRAAAETVGARPIQLDVTSDDSVRHAAETVGQEEGHLDVLVNNAGITGPLRDVQEYDGDDAAAVLLTDVVGYVRVIHAFLPLLERAPDPRIVNVSSGLGSFALFHDPSRIESRAGTPLYAAAKSAVNMLTARYARLLPGIHVNAADPGMTATDLSGGEGHPVEDGADAIIAFALGGPDPRAAALVEELRARSPEFARLWDRHEVAVRAEDHKTIVHPELGDIELDSQKLYTQNQAQALLVFTASPDIEAYEKLQLLSAIGTQQFDSASAQEGRDLRPR